MLRQGIQGICDLITQPGLINLDFADVKTIMTDAGSAMMGIGEGTGEHRAADAAQKAIASPLLETTIEGARGVIFNITGGPDMAMYEVNEAAEMISRAVDSDAQIIFGASIDPTMTGKVRVTVLAAGFGSPRSYRDAQGGYAFDTDASSTRSRRSTWTTSKSRRSCAIAANGATVNASPALDAMLGVRLPVLDDGFVRVVDYMGGDESIVQAARVSYGAGTEAHLRRSRAHSLPDAPSPHHAVRDVRDQVPRARADGLLAAMDPPPHCQHQRILDAILAGHRFRAGHEPGALAAAIERQSARQRRGYRCRGRPGSLRARDAQLQSLAREVYEERIAAGVAREQARKDLPVSTYTEAYWKIDLHNLFNFLALRMDAHAQEEIRRYATADRRTNRERRGARWRGKRSSTTRSSRSCFRRSTRRSSR